MEKYNLNEGDNSLNKILLMMKYDNKKTLSENEEISNITLNENRVNDYWNQLSRETKDKFAKINTAVSGAGTDEDKFVEGVNLLTKNDFNILQDLLKTVGMAGYRSFTDMVNGELGINDLKYVKSIVNHLVDIGFTSGYRESKGRFVEDSFSVEKPNNVTTTTTTVNNTNNNNVRNAQREKIKLQNQNISKEIQRTIGLPETGTLDTQSIQKLIDMLSDVERPKVQSVQDLIPNVGIKTSNTGEQLKQIASQQQLNIK